MGSGVGFGGGVGTGVGSLKCHNRGQGTAPPWSRPAVGGQLKWTVLAGLLEELTRDFMLPACVRAHVHACAQPCRESQTG